MDLINSRFLPGHQSAKGMLRIHLDKSAVIASAREKSVKKYIRLRMCLKVDLPTGREKGQ